MSEASSEREVNSSTFGMPADVEGFWQREIRAQYAQHHRAAATAVQQGHKVPSTLNPQNPCNPVRNQT